MSNPHNPSNGGYQYPQSRSNNQGEDIRKINCYLLLMPKNIRKGMFRRGLMLNLCRYLCRLRISRNPHSMSVLHPNNNIFHTSMGVKHPLTPGILQTLVTYLQLAVEAR